MKQQSRFRPAVSSALREPEVSIQLRRPALSHSFGRSCFSPDEPPTVPAQRYGYWRSDLHTLGAWWKLDFAHPLLVDPSLAKAQGLIEKTHSGIFLYTVHNPLRLLRGYPTPSKEMGSSLSLGDLCAVHRGCEVTSIGLGKILLDPNRRHSHCWTN